MIDVNTTDSTVPVNVDKQVTDNIYTDWDKKAIPQDHIKSADKLLGLVDNTFSSVPVSTLFDSYEQDRAKEYGVVYNHKTKSPILERVGNAVGMVANVGYGSEDVRNDFDNVYPWSHIRKCTLDDNGNVTAYEGEVNYKQDGTMGQVMLQIPKFYIKQHHDTINDLYYTYVCAKKKDGYRVAQPFINNAGEEIDYIYIGAYFSNYDSNNIAISVENQYDQPTNNYLNCSNYHKNRGENWHCLDATELFDVIRPLFMIEFATLDSEKIFNGYLYCDTDNLQYSVDADSYQESTNDLVLTSSMIEESEFYIGQEIAIEISTKDTSYKLEGFDFDDYGVKKAIRKIVNIKKEKVVVNGAEGTKWVITFSGSPINTDEETLFYDWYYRTGVTDNIKASSGYTGHSRYGYSSFAWRGLENLYLFKRCLVDGIITVTGDTHYYYTDDIRAYGTVTTEVATSADYHQSVLTYPLPEEGLGAGYISNLGGDNNAPWLMVPTELLGTSSTGYCDLHRRHPRMPCGMPTFGEPTPSEGGLFGSLFLTFNYTNLFAGRLAYRPYI